MMYYTYRVDKEKCKLSTVSDSLDKAEIQISALEKQLTDAVHQIHYGQESNVVSIVSFCF